MDIKYGNGQTKFGPGVHVELTGDHVAIAIDAFLVAHGIIVSGPRTITINGVICGDCPARVTVDPSGSVTTPAGRLLGRGYHPD